MACNLEHLLLLPELDAQHPHGSLQPSLTPVPRDLVPSDLQGHMAGTQYTYKLASS